MNLCLPHGGRIARARPARHSARAFRSALQRLGHRRRRARRFRRGLAPLSLSTREAPRVGACACSARVPLPLDARRRDLGVPSRRDRGGGGGGAAAGGARGARGAGGTRRRAARRARRRPRARPTGLYFIAHVALHPDVNRGDADAPVKFAAAAGAVAAARAAVAATHADSAAPPVHDVAVIGGGVAGLSVARSARCAVRRSSSSSARTTLRRRRRRATRAGMRTGYDAPVGRFERQLLRRSIVRHPELMRSFGADVRHVRSRPARRRVERRTARRP